MCANYRFYNVAKNLAVSAANSLGWSRGVKWPEFSITTTLGGFVCLKYLLTCLMCFFGGFNRSSSPDTNTIGTVLILGNRSRTSFGCSNMKSTTLIISSCERKLFKLATILVFNVAFCFIIFGPSSVFTVAFTKNFAAPTVRHKPTAMPFLLLAAELGTFNGVLLRTLYLMFSRR